MITVLVTVYVVDCGLVWILYIMGLGYPSLISLRLNIVHGGVYYGTDGGTVEGIFLK